MTVYPSSPVFENVSATAIVLGFLSSRFIPVFRHLHNQASCSEVPYVQASCILSLHGRYVPHSTPPYICTMSL